MNDTGPEKIGYLIREMRMRRGLTQQQFAELLETSQSAVARMEKGGQNFSTKELLRISEILGSKIIGLSERDDFRIKGGAKLSGSIDTNTSKNGAMGLFAAALLNRGTTILHGIPRIEEINRMMEVFASIGISVRWIANNSVEIKRPSELNLKGIDRDAAGRMRSTIMTIGALIHEHQSFRLPHSGGCKMGARTISAHRFGLEPLGVSIESEENDYLITSNSLISADITLYEASDTATENILIAAAKIPGITTIRFAQQNYMVREVCYFLEKLGVVIEGVGTPTLRVHGISDINQTIEYTNSEDPIESMMFIAAALVTQSKLTIKRCPIDFLRLELLKLKHMNARIDVGNEYFSGNQRTVLVDLTVHPSPNLVALPDKLHALPYPGINADNLPFFVPIATQATGTTLINDWMWEDRAIYFTELKRLGATMRLADSHRVLIEGPTKLTASEIVCPPALRPSTMILVAMLGAEGTSTLRNVYAIKRGYERVVERLNSIGAQINIVTDL